MAKNSQNRNGKMLLANWVEISELEYAQYRLQGYTIDADEYRVYWYLNDKRHREDGPAVIYADGGQAWWLNDKLHRTDGPAVILADGTQEWYQNGKPHREDGPAVIYADGTQEWYLNGKELTESEWQNAVGQLV
jgi:hypothetical protein